MDPKKLNIPNICFSLTSDDDKRGEKFSKQRMKRGFDDSELWSLRDTIGKFILPRLKRFRKITSSYPDYMTHEEWLKKIDKMIVAFELLNRDNGAFILTKKEEKQFIKGMKLYNKHFMDLWW